ncbi:hypothetical protein O9G_000814 [Rozella allomycis CSF55]|uniref:Geranylgeranyl transferase type-2 subunit alpha n=1 Tax=Rozella allomycis (strain CSF55) TaxID=988480 RepID=A0A075AW35_ROZAC|nr:hypothetical protein O9G_000814 [Rozella allomycis CSF55]|eukprot:EPZ32739.1 hypothetical protein O9G_000814 [Rozella allomycis CSF55]
MSEDNLLRWTERGLLLNADLYSLWNLRKRNFLKTKQQDLERAKILLENDLNLTKRCIQSFPKSYCVWFHRKWILNNSEKEWLNIEKELALTEIINFLLKFIDDEKRNLEFCLNFSNYSAWHHRSNMILNMHNDEKREAITKDIEFIKNAIFTEPNDQSAWFYYKWLINQSKLYKIILKLAATVRLLNLHISGGQIKAQIYPIFTDKEINLEKFDYGTFYSDCNSEDKGKIARGDFGFVIGGIHIKEKRISFESMASDIRNRRSMIVKEIETLSELHKLEPTAKCKETKII